MSGHGKGDKGLGKGGAKCHHKILYDNIQGITRPSICRLTCHGSVKCISGLIYEETMSSVTWSHTLSMPSARLLLLSMLCMPSNVQGIHFMVLVHRHFAFGCVLIVVNMHWACLTLPQMMWYSSCPYLRSFPCHVAFITKVGCSSSMSTCLTVVFHAHVLVVHVCM